MISNRDFFSSQKVPFFKDIFLTFGFSTKIIIISYSVALLSETFCTLRNVALKYFEEKLFVFFGKMGIKRFVHYAFLKNDFFKNLSK